MIEDRVHFCFDLSKYVYDTLHILTYFNLEMISINESRLEVQLKTESSVTIDELIEFLKNTFNLNKIFYKCYCTALVTNTTTEQRHLVKYEVTNKDLQNIEALLKVSI